MGNESALIVDDRRHMDMVMNEGPSTYHAEIIRNGTDKIIPYKYVISRANDNPGYPP